uniref:Uncharacterized protein n=1 Tax=Arundo donax TaxID=35708 RepID=A0A0A9FZ65_ARUDO
MVEVRKAKGDTLEFHKVTTICAKIMPMKETHVYQWTMIQKLGHWLEKWINSCYQYTSPIIGSLDALSYSNL